MRFPAKNPQTFSVFFSSDKLSGRVKKGWRGRWGCYVMGGFIIYDVSS